MSAVGAHTYPAVASGNLPTLPISPDMETSSATYPKNSAYRNRAWAAGQPKSYVWLEAEQAFLVSDGYSPMRVIKGSNVMRVGLLPPTPDPITVAPTGAKATMTIDLSGIGHNAGDFFFVGDNVTTTSIYWVTALITDPSLPAFPGNQVLIGATAAATLANLVALINGTTGQDVTYVNALRSVGAATWSFAEVYSIVASGTGPVTITATGYGTVGNSFRYSAFDVGGVVTMTPTNLTWATINYFSGGADGSGTAPGVGQYEYTYRHYRKHDHALSGIGTRVTTELGVPMNVDLTMTDPADDPLITHLEWLRSLHRSGQFYAGGRIATGGAGTATDALSDDVLGLNGIPYNNLKYRPWANGHVPSYRCVEFHLGRVFGGGAFTLDDKAISLDLTAGSLDATVTAGSQPWTSDMEGGIVTITSRDGEEYLVVDYDTATWTVRLNIAWKGSTGTEVGTWRDGRDPTYLAWSEPTAPNQWPPANGLVGVADETGEGITGLKAHWSRLNVFTPESIYALSGVEGSFQLRRIVEGVGTSSHHGIVEAEGNLYFPHDGAIFVWGGDETPINLTNPPGEPKGLQDTMVRITWEVADQIQGHFDTTERVIRWAVPLDGHWVPTHTLVYDIQNQSWTLDSGLQGDLFTSLSSGGRTDTFSFGHGRGFVYGVDDQDNWYVSSGHVHAITAVSNQKNSVTASTLSSSTGTAVGAAIVTAAGDYITGTFIGGASNELTLDRGVALVDYSVAIGDQILMGGILFYLRTGEMSFGYMGRAGRITDLDIGFVPQTAAGRIYTAVGSDSSDPTIPEFGDGYGDLTDSDGHWRARPNAGGRRQTLDIFTAFPKGRPEIIEMGIGYRTPNKQRHRV